MFGWSGTLNSAQTAEIAAEQVIYDGFKAVEPRAFRSGDALDDCRSDCFLDEFAEAGSDSFLVHWEGNNNLHRTVRRIKALEESAGVAINPATPASVLEELLPDVTGGA
jgi:hypothetical protein